MAPRPPLLFLHGVRLSGAMWEPQRRKLAGEFTVLTPDLPGHRTLRRERFTFDAAVGAARRALDEAEAGGCVVVGLSLGGYVAMEMLRVCPERLRGAVLSGCTREPTGVSARVHDLVAWLSRGWPERLFEYANAWFFRAFYPQATADAIVAGGFYPRTLPAAAAALRGRRFLPAVAGFPGPLLMLNGRWDFVFRRDEARFVGAARQGRLTVLPRAGHLANLDRPAAFSQAVEEFARALGTGDRRR